MWLKYVEIDIFMQSIIFKEKSRFSYMVAKIYNNLM